MQKNLNNSGDIPTSLKNAIQEHTSSGFLLFFYDSDKNGVIVESATNERDRNALRLLSINYHNKMISED